MNPALELASLLSVWVPNGASPADARAKLVDGDESAMWRSVSRGAALVDEILAALEGLRRAGTSTAGFDRYVVEWQRAVFSVDSPWKQPTGAQVVSAEAYAALHALGLVLDLGALPPVDDRRRGALLGILDEADTLLQGDADHLSTSEREYLWRLISGARGYLDERAGLGESDLREHVDRLSGALIGLATRLAEDGDKSTAARLFSVGVRLAAAGRTALYDAAAVATIVAAAVDGVKAITGG